MGPDALRLGWRAHDGSDTAGHRALTDTLSLQRKNPLLRGAGEGWEGSTGVPACLHCGQPAPAGRCFCCAGCAAAYDTIQALGLGRYYAQRVLDATLRAPRPEPIERRDFTRFIAANA